jgi:hypothetical protein
MRLATRSAKRTWPPRVAVAGVLAALFAVAAAAPARAGQDPGIRLGMYQAADADKAVVTVGVFERLDIPGPLNLELSADYRKERLAGGGVDATVIPVRVSAYFSFLPVVSPYVLAGVGADFVHFGFNDTAAGDGRRTDVAFEVHGGGGVEISLGPVSVIGDLRYCKVQPLSNGAVSQALGHDYDPSGWHASLSAGISF